MNVYIGFGIVFIALGTLLLSYGSVFQARRDSQAAEQRLRQIAQDVAELRGRPQDELSDDAITKVEGEVREWAREFLTDKSQRKLQYDKRRTIEDERRASAHRLALQYFRFLVVTLREAAASYGQDLGREIPAVLPEPDTELFTDAAAHYSGEVTFGDSAAWVLRAQLSEPTPDVSAPQILLSLMETHPDGGDAKAAGEILLRFGPDSRTFHLRVRGAFALAFGNSGVTEPADKYEPTIKALIRSVLEGQLLRSE